MGRHIRQKMTTSAENLCPSTVADDPATRRRLRVLYLGRADYVKTLELQRRLVLERAEGVIPDSLILVEHNPVITVGRSGNPNHIVASREVLGRMGIGVYEIERGGDVTYHGPGQLVGYPIMRLAEGLRGAVPFLRSLEEVLILALQEFGVRGFRRQGLTGVWTSQGKVAAIGVAVRKNVTFHGFALNVTTDLSHFRFIVPCGLANEPVTSLEKLVGGPVSLEAVADAVVSAFCYVFDKEPDRESLPLSSRKQGKG
jgi:lipoate-protein ligase B